MKKGRSCLYKIKESACVSKQVENELRRKIMLIYDIRVCVLAEK